MPELERALVLNPKFPSGEVTLASAYSALGKPADALVHWQKAVALEPQRVSALIGEARILSSTPDFTIRNGAEAVALAKRADELTQGTDVNVLDALGAAYAEAGQFQDALDTAKRALDLAVSKGDAAKAKAIQYRINLYTEGKPYRN